MYEFFESPCFTPSHILLDINGLFLEISLGNVEKYKRQFSITGWNILTTFLEIMFEKMNFNIR